MRSRSWTRSRHISAGAGVGPVGTFCSEPEQSKKVSTTAAARKERKNHKKKTQRVKCNNAESIIFTAQFLPFSRPGNLEWPQRKSILPRSFPAPPVWSGHIGLCHPSSDCDGTMAGSRCTGAGWAASNRGEANSFI